MKEKDQLYWQELQQTNLLLGGQVIEVILEGDQPTGIRVNFKQLDHNFSLTGAESATEILHLFHRHARGLAQLTQVSELSATDRWQVRLQLCYTQALLGLLSLFVHTASK